MAKAQEQDQDELEVADTGEELNGVEVIETEEAEAAADPEQPEEGELEARARRLGWAPKDQWRGDPAKWKTAEDFLALSSEKLPVALERLRKQDAELTSVKKQLDVLSKRVVDQDKRGYERAMAEIRAGKKQAVADGDTAAFEAFEAKEDELRKAAPEPEPAKKEEPVESPDITSWKSKNKWFGNKRGMTDTAIGQYNGYFESNSDESMDDEEARARAFRFVEKRMRMLYPDEFENPNRRTAPAVNGVTPKKANGVKTFADLPPDAKAACEKFVRDGIFKSREEYTKDYFAQ